jgi:hypothetical protein
LNAANSSIRHDRAAAIRPLGNDGRRARRARIRHSEQQLRARIRRTIRAQWTVKLAWATASAGRRRRRPLENAAVFVALLVLPLSQRPCARWGCPRPRSDAVSICVVLERNATHHPSQMVPSKAASMRRAALLAVARGRPKAARRHRVAAAWCLLRGCLLPRRPPLRAAHSALSVDRSRFRALLGNLCPLHARTHSPVSACVRCGNGGHRTPAMTAAGGWTTAHTAGLELAAHNAPCAVRQCAQSPLRLEGLLPHACMRALAHTHTRTHTHFAQSNSHAHTLTPTDPHSARAHAHAHTKLGRYKYGDI